jgi:hypothetical protein
MAVNIILLQYATLELGQFPREAKQEVTHDDF